MTIYTPVTLGPKYGVSIEDLEDGDGLRLTCAVCRHQAVVPAAALRARWPAYRRLIDIKDRFPCGRCHNRTGNYWMCVREIQ
jgi:hypothetical protein